MLPAGVKFKRKLINYASSYTPLQLTLITGGQLKGVAYEVEANFIIVINKENNFVSIPLDKIAAVKSIKKNIKLQTHRKHLQPQIRKRKSKQKNKPNSQKRY